MKECSWQKVIISWANALQLREKIISDITDLLDGSFFICLLNQLGHESQREVNEMQVVDRFIIDNYSGVKLKSEWDSKEVILISSLLLLTSSLEVSHLRAPLYCLDTDIQLNIQAFIQRFLSFPKNSITREAITEAIESIETSEDIEDQDSDEPSSFVSSPNSSFTPAFVSPDLKVVTMNKIKSLQRQVEILNLDKQYLQEELELNKQISLESDIKCNAKEQEILRLRNELFLQGNNCSAEDEQFLHKTLHFKEMEKIRMLKDDLSLLQAALCLTRTELEVTVKDNQDLRDKLQRNVDEKAGLEQKYEESETKLASMLISMEEMTSKLSVLKQTCLEQEDLLREKGGTNVLDESSMVINEESTTASGAGESLASIVDLKYAELEEESRKLRERLADSEAKLLVLQQLLSHQELSEIKGDLSKLDEEIMDNTFMEGLKENESQNRNLGNMREITKLSENLRTIVISKNLHLNQLRCDVKNEREETDRLREMLEAKTVRLEECTALADKLRRNLNERENEIKTITATLKRTLSENEHLKTIHNLNQSELEDVRCQLEMCDSRLVEKDDRIAALSADIGERVCEMEQLKEQISVYEQRLLTNMANLKNKDSELNEVRTALDKCKGEMEELRNHLCTKASLIAELQHDVQMCQHEKGVLQKEMENLVKNVKKNETLRKDLTKYEQEIVQLKNQLEEEKANMKVVQDQVELEDKLNNAFDAKLTELQMKMKMQYEKELSGTIEEYKDKINQLRLKLTKDKLHIQELSAELWNTTDKLLLSQQQSEALRNQLRRTKCALEILNNSAIRRHSLATSAAIQRASNPCLWLQAEETESNPLPLFDDLLSTNGKGIALPSLDYNSLSLEFPRRRKFSLVMENSAANDVTARPEEDEDQEEIFNDDFLQDLKDGICRLPNENKLQRASCPPVGKQSDSPPIHIGKVSDKQVLIPPEKPKRKGQLAYSKPGPPTPCRTAAARLSLQNFEKPEQRKLRDNNCVQFLPPPGPSRLSKLFATAKGQNKTKPVSQESPKVKRKSFFQRKFGSNRENLPPS